MIPQSGRSVARLPQLRLQCLSNSRRGFGSCHPQRVAIVHSNLQSQNLFDLVHHDFSGKPMPHRTYATKPVSRPKAHTGRTTAARKAPTTSKTAAAKKPAAKKTSPKPRPTAKSTAKLRTRAKPKRATKAKAKRKPRKRVLSETQKKKVEAQKKRVVIKNLKVTALQPPTGMPSTAWEVFSQEAIRGHKLDRLGAKMKELSTQYKNISPEQLEVCIRSFLATTVALSDTITPALQPHRKSKQSEKQYSIPPMDRIPHPGRNPRCQSRTPKSQETRRERIHKQIARRQTG